MRGEDRREQLLDCALELFGRRGFEATSTRDIAEAAGVTDGLIYKYFASKDELLEEVIARAGQQIREEPLELPAAASPRETLAMLLFEIAQRMRGQQQLVDLLWEVSRRAPSGIAHIEHLNRTGYLRCSQTLGELAGLGAICVDLVELHGLMSQLAFCFAALHRWDDEPTWLEALQSYAWSTTGVLLHGAGPR
ncbi:MAG: TetR/AcrR family transcriptional regulator [Rubrivivax sp.]|nr:TetR/AcrR family transcriptional regulator [Rubrivivax sp.]